MRSWPGAFLEGSLLIIKVISDGVVCFAGKDIGSGWFSIFSIVRECSLSFISLCGLKLSSRYVDIRLTLSILVMARELSLFLNGGII